MKPQNFEYNNALEKHLLRNGICLFHYDVTDSTNQRAKEYACSQENKKLPALFLADSQSAGSGRQGKSFFSPDKTGLYITLLTEIDEKNDAFALLTSLAAVCAAEAIENTSNKISPKIKWVNDIYIDEKKVAGILAQTFTKEDKRYVAIGLGVNISTQSFPEELKNTARSLFEGALSEKKIENIKAQITIGFCQNMLDALNQESHEEYMKKYRERSCVIGKRVCFIKNGEEYFGKATSIHNDGALEISLDSGTIEILRSGEISLRTEPIC